MEETKTTREKLEEAYLETLMDSASALIAMELNHTISDLTDDEFGSFSMSIKTSYVT